MKTKHAQGEWKVYLNDYYPEIQPLRQGENFLNISVHLNDKDNNSISLSDENIANAKLISAAPDLLEALQEVLNEKVSPIDGSSPELSNSLRNKIDAAIEKATK